MGRPAGLNLDVGSKFACDAVIGKCSVFLVQVSIQNNHVTHQHLGKPSGLVRSNRNPESDPFLGTHDPIWLKSRITAFPMSFMPGLL